MLLVYLIAAIVIYVWGIFFSGAWGEKLLTEGLLTDGGRIAAVTIVALAYLTILVGLVRLVQRRRTMSFGVTRSNEAPSVALMLLVAGLLPIALFLTDGLIGWQLLEPGCSAGRIADYFWLVVDSFVKGAALDAMESFHIDLHACAPNNHSLLASTTVFAMRTFVTYVVIFGIVQIYFEGGYGKRNVGFGTE